MAWPLQNDFNYGILNEVSHRPWPMPQSPWVMTQTWHELLFAHWPVETAALRDKVPDPLSLDTFAGEAWLGIVPFRMTNVSPRAFPALPFVSAFPELNVRTYVTLDGKPGVYFFSLDAANAIAVGVARLLAHLPYYTASMDVVAREDWIHYRSRRTASGAPPAEWTGRYRPVGAPRQPLPGTLEHFLTERYCLYTVDGDGRAHRLDIHHPPWLLQQAEAEIAVNTMAEAAGIGLSPVAPLLHYAARQDMAAWMPTIPNL
jgi:uncharacterized protein YqjF (DUF2071 family)